MSANVTMTYGNYTFDPIPLMAYAREPIFNDNNDKLYDRITLSFAGWLTNPGGNFGKLDVEKFSPLASGLALQKQQLILTHQSGIFVSGVFPRVQGFSVDEDVWVHKLRYSFEMVYEENNVDLGASGLVDNVADSWNWSEEENDTAAVSHTVSARGIDFSSSGGNDALTNAKNFVDVRLGLSEIPISFPQKVFQLYNSKSYIRKLYSESVDKESGTYSVTENFVLASGLANNFIDRKSFSFQRDGEGIINVSVQGSIEGGGDTAFERFNAAASAWNASVESDTYVEASGVYNTFGGTFILGQNYTSKSLSINKNAGVIDYSLSYTDKLEDNPEGVVDANFRVDETKPIAVVASQQVIGKTDGPVWQDLNTVTEGTYTVSGDVKGTTLINAIAHAQTIINTYGGQSIGTERRITAHTFNKDPKARTVNFSITWTYKGDAADSLLN